MPNTIYLKVSSARIFAMLSGVSATSASNAASPRSRSRSPVFRDWNVEILPLSGVPIRINVDVDASMGQIMSRVAKVVGSTSERRIERFGCLVPLGTKTIEQFHCRHPYTRVMQTKLVRHMLVLDQIARFQLVFDETLDARRSEGRSTRYI